MNFGKVSESAFQKDCEKFLGTYDELWYDNIVIPERSTAHSAGYDFRSPIGFASNHYPVRGDNMIFIPTGVKVNVDRDKFLAILPRSSFGNQGIMLANTMGVIDSDYYNNPDNEGDIIIALYFYKQAIMSHMFHTIKEKQKIAQGVILPYFTIDEDETTAERTGGLGSTGL